jgi:hypothetical protein
MSEYRITENLTFKEAWDVCKADATARMTHPGWDDFWTRISPDAEINVIDATRNDWRVRVPIKAYTAAEALELPIGTKLVGVPEGLRVCVGGTEEQKWLWNMQLNMHLLLTDLNLRGPWRVVSE